MESLKVIRKLSSKVITNITSSPYKNLIIGQQNSIRTVGLNRPAKRNCLDTETVRELRDALDDFDIDPKSSVVVLHGEAGNFCAGLDIDEILQRGYQAVYDDLSILRRIPLTLKPSVCAINGYAVAEGLELALMTDFQVVEDTATIGAAGRRYGVPLAFSNGCLNHISLTVKKLLLSGSAITGVTIKEMGFADRIVATDTALGQAVSQAVMVSKYPQKSLIYDKLSMLMQTLPTGNEQRAAIEKQMEILWPEVVNEANEKLKQFSEGVGKHGSYWGFVKRRAKNWEVEEDIIAGNKTYTT